MKLQLNNNESINLVKSYRHHQINIGESRFLSAVIVTPEAIHDLKLSTISELTGAHFDILLDLKPELVVLGTGITQVFPDLAIARGLVNQQIGLEVMDSSAACRTYNVLAGDGRKVAALLFP